MAERRETITRERFIAATGREPIDDDLDRCNCRQAGEIAHMCCGWNYLLDRPQSDIGPLPGPPRPLSVSDPARSEEEP